MVATPSQEECVASRGIQAQLVDPRDEQVFQPDNRHAQDWVRVEVRVRNGVGLVCADVQN